ncbi:MAG TPA: formate/nitrite transporter family protein [Burkholderiales bacterium]|jgi:formate/nitrite transporter|nr:formate/nitrite transporter family protein [Burkholderiales bacterium]
MKFSEFDAYTPREITQRVEEIGVTKARLPLLSLAMLGLLAGAFIGLGALYFVLVAADPTLGFAETRLFGGLVFSLGLILVIVAGAELFTGNNLLAMAWVDRKITTKELLRNWFIVCATNFVGAFGLALLVYWSGHTDMNNGLVAIQYVKIAAMKSSLPFVEAFFLGVLCNSLVCMAVWMALAGRSVIDKTVAIVFPISAFVAAGFEHSIANMYLIPMGLLLKSSVSVAVPNIEALTWIGFLHNLAPVLAGNVVGGSIFVALVYYIIYGRAAKEPQPTRKAREARRNVREVTR